jgi:L-asparaginase
MKRNSLSTLVSAALLSTALSAVAADKPGVTIYATGGTIAGESKSNTDTTNYKIGSLGVEVLIKAVPELKNVASVSAEQFSNIGSFDFTQELLLKLSKAINSKLAEKDTHGVVIIQGTATAEETAFFLDLTVKSSKPVVVVGAMRPATAISADGPMNLLEAVTLAASKDAENRGTMVVLNDRIAPAFYVTKTNSNTLDTFRAADQGYLGTFISGVPKFYYEPAKPVGKPVFDVSKLETLPKVTILYSYQDQDAALLDAAVKDGAKGIVIAGTGNGSIPSSLKAKIAELMAKGIPVVRSTRTGSGFVTTEHFGNGGIGAGYFNPQKSRILLMLALAEGAGVEKIRTYFGSSPRDDL